jgi:hypothetical protein
MSESLQKRRISRLLVASLAALIFVTAAHGQGYTIQAPADQQPSLVTPYANGGYLVQTPRQPPTFANPMGNSGYVVQRPGQIPTFINPTIPLNQPGASSLKNGN